MNPRINYTLIFAVLFLLNFDCQWCIAQHEDVKIDYKKIKQRKVRKLVRQQYENAKGLSKLEISVTSKTDLKDYFHYEKEYLVKESPDEVWFNYRNSDQTEIWNISRISFGLIYCREEDSIIYANQMLFGLEEKRIYFINLKILNGFYNLPVAFEVTKIDHDKKLIEFSYMRGGKAMGKQVIKFTETEDGYTSINHQSFVKSESKLRDKYLYPYFHNKLINEFHFNMKRFIASRVKHRIDLIAEVQ